MKKLKRRIMSFEDSLEELEELGSPLDLTVATAVPGSCQLEMEQTGNPEENKVFQLEDGRIGYMVSVCVTNQTSKTMYIDYVDLQVPWEERLFEWLLPKTATFKNRKKAKASSYERYKFPGKNGLELPIEEVINHALTPDTRLFPRRRVRGWLLATGGPMPKNLIQGAQIRSSLVITTSDHLEHREQILLWTERLQSRPTRPKRTTGLFERSVVAEHVPGDRRCILPPENRFEPGGFEVEDIAQPQRRVPVT